MITFSSSICNNTFTEKFENFWISNFGFRRREIQGWYKLAHWYFSKFQC